MLINISKIEQDVLKFWKKNKIFEKSLRERKKCPIFGFYDGPPFATGSPHYGHILASTIKDVVPRYWAMKGYYVPRRWGWDCHGLPIENIVEEKLKISGKKEIEKIGIKKFNKVCQNSVLVYAKEWGKMVDRIGRFIDFENAYKTMDNNYIESVWWALKEIWKKGLIYEGRKVLLYCPRCECPISNFEVAMDSSYRELKEESIIVKFRTKNAEEIIGIKDKNLFLLAWTTTPWTLPANTALAVAKNLDYILVRQNKEFYILAESRKETLNGNFQVLKKYKGRDLIGIEYEPLFQMPSKNNYKVVPADFVSSEEGTGIVHIAPVYGEDDYKLGIEFNLPIIPLLDVKGKFNEKAPKFIQKKGFKESEALIKNDLFQRNLLYKKEKTSHSYPFCWRCGTTLFYNAIPAWFINIQKIKKKLIRLNKNINWHPSHLKYGRFLKGIESAPDWTISRNRYWASPLPIWKCNKCGQQEIIGSKKDLLKQKFSTNKYFILRHGQTIYQTEKKEKLYPYPEKKPIKLTQKGEKQINSLICEIKKLNIDFIYSSDTYRVKQTAGILSKELGLKINLDSHLRDINWGIYNGKTKKEFFKYFSNPEERFYKRPKKGENWLDIKKRMTAFIKKIDKKHQNKTILIVSHGDPLWLLQGAMNGLTNKGLLKEIRGGFIKTAELRHLKFKNLPYNQNGELDFHRPYIDEIKFFCPKCKEKMTRISEVIDCWMESASMPFAEIHYPFENKNYFKNRFPAHFVAEYIAQTRAWFYVMHVVAAVLFNKEPFKNVIATGTILNEKGEKLSKSKKNFPDPWQIIDKYGVDALRFYLMSSLVMKGEDLFFSEKELKEIYQKNILILLNVFSFYETYQLPLSFKPKSSYILDKWILSRLNELTKKTIDRMNNYDVVPATKAIKDFISDLSLWYLRRSRKRFKNGDKKGIKTFGYVIFQLSKIIAPFTPFIADYIYQAVGAKKKSVHLEDFPKPNQKLINKKLNQHMDLIRKIVSLGLKVRALAGIKVRQPLSVLKIQITNFKLQKELLELIKDELNVEKIDIVKAIKKPTVRTQEKNWVIEKEDSLKISLNIKITPKLKEQGILREATRHIQKLRKELGLKPRHKILIGGFGPTFLNKILLKNKDFILKETIAKDFILDKDLKLDFNIKKEVKINQEKLWLAIKKL
jgi:isoleucyl-tRNA synthetase